MSQSAYLTRVDCTRRSYSDGTASARTRSEQRRRRQRMIDYILQMRPKISYEGRQYHDGADRHFSGLSQVHYQTELTKSSNNVNRSFFRYEASSPMTWKAPLAASSVLLSSKILIWALLFLLSLLHSPEMFNLAGMDAFLVMQEPSKGRMQDLGHFSECLNLMPSGPRILQVLRKYVKALLLKLDSIYCSSLDVFVRKYSILPGAELLHVLIELVKALHLGQINFICTVLEADDGHDLQFAGYQIVQCPTPGSQTLLQLHTLSLVQGFFEGLRVDLGEFEQLHPLILCDVDERVQVALVSEIPQGWDHLQHPEQVWHLIIDDHRLRPLQE